MALKIPISPFSKSPLKHRFSSSHFTHLKSSLDKFLYQDCRSGNFTLPRALEHFDSMIRMQPKPPISSFTTLLSILVKYEHYDYVLVLFKRLYSIGFLPNLFPFNILMNCFCKMGRVSDAFAFLATILRRGFIPSTVTFTCLIKGLCVEGRILKASVLFEKMPAFGCTPDVVAYTALLNGLCRTGNAC